MSSYWKKPLLQMADRLRIQRTKEKLTERQLAQVERDIFIGFYSVRKLIETITKVTDSAKSMKVNLDWYPNIKKVTWRNNHKLDELYDFNRPKSETRDIRFVCGRIIHSFIFTPCLDESGLCGVLFTSDLDKDNRLYLLKTEETINVYERFGNDDVTEIHWHRDPKTGKEETRAN